MGKNFVYLCLLMLAGYFTVSPSMAFYDDFEKIKIGIMQDQKGTAGKYQSLKRYLWKFGFKVELVGFANYREAVEKFKVKEINAMFAGSAVAGIYIIKKMAMPVVRPLRRDGGSHYYAVLVGRKNQPQFQDLPSYFRGKKIAYAKYASSGEFYYKSIVSKSKYKAESVLEGGGHGEAFQFLKDKKADVVIMKNLVWDKIKKNSNEFIQLGEDFNQNPDNTLIVSIEMPVYKVEKLRTAFLSLSTSIGPEAEAVRTKMGIIGFIDTKLKDFKYTLGILKDSNVDGKYSF